jgi:hypothetical protein
LKCAIITIIKEKELKKKMTKIFNGYFTYNTDACKKLEELCNKYNVIDWQIIRTHGYTLVVRYKED